MHACYAAATLSWFIYRLGCCLGGIEGNTSLSADSYDDRCLEAAGALIIDIPTAISHMQPSVSVFMASDEG